MVKQTSLECYSYILAPFQLRTLTSAVHHSTSCATTTVRRSNYHWSLKVLLSCTSNKQVLSASQWMELHNDETRAIFWFVHCSKVYYDILRHRIRLGVEWNGQVLVFASKRGSSSSFWKSRHHPLTDEKNRGTWQLSERWKHLAATQ